MFSRILKIRDNYSFFVFGPRGCGKSTLLTLELAKKAKLWIDLLQPDEEHIFQTNPAELRARTQKLVSGDVVVIDEIQRAPKLLDLVHSLIESKGIIFALTGSSARKLRRGAANLLAGRAFVNHMFPLTSIELADSFDLSRALCVGMLPKIYDWEDEDSHKKFLRAYANTYLKEEIQAEQLVRNIPQFRRFLEVAGQMHSKPLNYSKIGRDIGADHSVVSNYYDILEDTLIGFRLPPYDKSVRKQQRQSPKFYFIDEGIRRAIDRSLEIKLKEATYEYGRGFESFFISEIHKLCSYRDKDEALSFILTKDDAEIDLIIDRPGKNSLVMEIKSARLVHEQDIQTLRAFSEKLDNAQLFLISQDPHTKTFGRVNCMFWRDFIDEFWRDSFN